MPTVIVTKGDSASNTDVPFTVGIAFGALFVSEKANGTVSFMYYDLIDNHVSANAWHHVAASVKGSTKQATLYLDGIQVLQGTLSVVTGVGNSAPLSIGRNGGPSGYANFMGLIDDVRIWNTVRMAAQIGANYKTQFTTSQAGLVGNWRFDEGSGTTTVDYGTAPADNATLNGGAAFSLDVHP